jgi:PhoD-like phosphatase
MAGSTACYQLASPPGTLRLWLGAFPATAPPAVGGWQIDGTPVPPAQITALRRMQSVRAGALVKGNPGRAFSGVYEITGIASPAHSKIEVTVGGERVVRRAKSLPKRLELGGDALTMLLVSCYHYTTDGRLYGQLLPRIVRGATPPDLCMFMGDQVYLDLPTIQDFHDDPAWLADKFERDYVRNWFSGAFTEGLGLAPLAFVPDDHEYWNNFPHVSPLIQNSWSAAGQDNWRRAARACYEGFQLGFSGALGEALSFDVEPLSFLLLDSRSERDTDLKRLLSSAAEAQLNAWAAHVAGNGNLVGGVMVTGQTLLEDAVGGVKGAIADYALADYAGPYAALLKTLAAITDSGKQVLLLTGDVHWGRITSIRDRRRDVTVMHEVITSPASLVATVGSDQVADVIGAVKTWFGMGDPWPRHGDGKKPPSHLPHSSQRFRTEAWRAHRGNQCAVLRLARRGSGVSVEYTFHPFAGAGVPATTGRFELLPTL